MASREVSGNRRGETFEGRNPKSVTGAKQTRSGGEGTRRQEVEKTCRCRPGGIGPPPTWNPSLPRTLKGDESSGERFTARPCCSRSGAALNAQRIASLLSRSGLRPAPAPPPPPSGGRGRRVGSGSDPASDGCRAWCRGFGPVISLPPLVRRGTHTTVLDPAGRPPRRCVRASSSRLRSRVRHRVGCHHRGLARAVTAPRRPAPSGAGRLRVLRAAKAPPRWDAARVRPVCARPGVRPGAGRSSDSGPARTCRAPARVLPPPRGVVPLIGRSGVRCCQAPSGARRSRWAVPSGRLRSVGPAARRRFGGSIAVRPRRSGLDGPSGQPSRTASRRRALGCRRRGVRTRWIAAGPDPACASRPRARRVDPGRRPCRKGELAPRRVGVGCAASFALGRAGCTSGCGGRRKPLRLPDHRVRGWRVASPASAGGHGLDAR